MTIYVINGINYDPTEQHKYAVTHVFKSRAAAEEKLRAYQTEIRYIFKTIYEADKIQFVERHYNRNCHIEHYVAEIQLNMCNSRHREIYIKDISSGFLSESIINWSAAIDTHTKEIRLTDMTIKTVEI